MSEAVLNNIKETLWRELSFKEETALRFLVLWRDSFQCVYCGASRVEHPGLRLNVDHIVPRSAGGQYVLSNLVTACAKCNLGKNNIELPGYVKTMIVSIMEQNSQRFRELEGLDGYATLERLFGPKRYRKQITFERDGKSFLINRWGLNCLEITDRETREHILYTHPCSLECCCYDWEGDECPLCMPGPTTTKTTKATCATCGKGLNQELLEVENLLATKGLRPQDVNGRWEIP